MTNPWIRKIPKTLRLRIFSRTRGIQVCYGNSKSSADVTLNWDIRVICYCCSQASRAKEGPGGGSWRRWWESPDSLLRLLITRVNVDGLGKGQRPQ